MTRPSRPPDLTGPYGRAWKIDPEDRHNAELNPISYLIEAPGQSPLWNWYFLGLIDLDGPAADGSYAHKEFSDARWEIGVYALNPDHEPYDPDAFDMAPLLPQNVRVHIADHPLDTLTSMVDAIVEVALKGAILLEPPLSPETHWDEWRRWIQATLDHPHHG